MKESLKHLHDQALLVLGQLAQIFRKLLDFRGRSALRDRHSHAHLSKDRPPVR
ncbi:MAG: hypothetical protein K9N23_14885 [Akkermansiaceae bacterium]|nr:hypothetical protein [Akkermansiaceae bacterium]MCF7732971.1 hypothetical protein [Akkermansiaceae bacterium]